MNAITTPGSVMETWPETLTSRSDDYLELELETEQERCK